MIIFPAKRKPSFNLKINDEKIEKISERQEAKISKEESSCINKVSNMISGIIKGAEISMTRNTY